MPSERPDTERARLDSWKEIADYLGRDVRTVMRWEKSKGLPVCRVPGGKGHSVFAFEGDLDAWLAAPNDHAESDLAPPADRTADPESSRPARPSGDRPLGSWWRWGAVAALVVIASGVWWTLSRAGAVPSRITIDRTQVTAADAAGRSLWTFPFAPRQMPGNEAPESEIRDLDGDGQAEVLVRLPQFTVPERREEQSGELLSLSAQDGRVRWRYVPNDRLNIGANAYASPWPMKDWSVEPGRYPARVAVTVHHFTAFPSFVVVLDAAHHAAGRFVNAGWIQWVRWFDSPAGRRLVVGGVSNSQNGGMMAVLDPDHLDGRSPEASGTTFECVDCPLAGPQRYVVFPRSELNLATTSSFNEAHVEVFNDRIVAQTFEVSAQTAGTEAAVVMLYEFSLSLHPIRAYFSDRYWDLHKRLEREGKIGHSAEQCPERLRAPEVRVWAPDSGWHTMRFQ